MANSMERSARDPSVAQGVDLHLADARWLVGHHEPIYSSTDVVRAVDSVGNLSFGDQKKFFVEIPTSWNIPTIYGFLTPCFKGVSISSHLHFFGTFDLTRNKVRALLRGHEKGATRGGEKNDGKTLMETDPRSTIEKEKYL